MDLATIVSIVIIAVVLVLIGGLIALSYGVSKASAKRKAAQEEEAAAEQPAAEEPATEEPVAEEPATEEPVAEEPATEEPAAEEPAAEEPATEEPAAEEPAAEEPVAEEPATEQPVAEEAAVTSAPAAQPVAVASTADVAGESLIVKNMSPALREALGVVGAEHDEEVYSVRYSYSFTARLVLSDETIRNYYSELIDEIASYKKMRRRMSRRQQNVSISRQRVAVVLFKGKKLCLALALDPKEYEGTKYRGKDVSSMKRFAATPMLLKVDSARKIKYAKYLLGRLAEANGLQQGKIVSGKDAEVPAYTRDELIAQKEIKVSGKKIEPEA